MKDGARSSAAAMCSAADHTHHSAPAPHHAQQAETHRHQHFVQEQTAARQAPARARLLFVNGIAKAAVGFFLHGRHCRERRRAAQASSKVACAARYDTMRRCKPRPFLQAPPRDSISAGAKNHWLGCASISRASAMSIAFSLRAAACTTTSSITPTTSSTCCCRIIAITRRAKAWIGSRSCSATAS